jgi:predicted RNase H-like HicB family nuclease
VISDNLLARGSSGWLLRFCGGIWLGSVERQEQTVSYRIRLLETEEGWSVSCLDLPGCHSQGDTRDEALTNIREAIGLWLQVEAEEAGVKQVETLELAI